LTQQRSSSTGMTHGPGTTNTKYKLETKSIISKAMQHRQHIVTLLYASGVLLYAPIREWS